VGAPTLPNASSWVWTLPGAIKKGSRNKRERTWGEKTRVAKDGATKAKNLGNHNGIGGSRGRKNARAKGGGCLIGDGKKKVYVIFYKITKAEEKPLPGKLLERAP